MALTEAELLRINRHLVGKLRACPMCGNDKWQPLEVVGPRVFRRYLPDQYTEGSAAATLARLYTENTTSTEIVPLLLIACTNCFHVVPYAWKLIEAQK